MFHPLIHANRGNAKVQSRKRITNEFILEDANAALSKESQLKLYSMLAASLRGAAKSIVSNRDDGTHA